MKRKSDSKIQDYIAHEIAHAFLKHNSGPSNPNKEKEADDLIESWGFKRAYRTYEPTRMVAID
jgi:predicted SprT family Zn-dependent metalloprotease